MMTFDGIIVHPSLRNAPSLEAVAIGLALRPRWAGQTNRPFNVLAHSFLVAALVEHPYFGPLGEAARDACHLHALLHDAAEAIVGDIPTTWKTDDDRRREQVILACLYESLDLSWPPAMDIARLVASADFLALRAEGTLLMPPGLFTDGWSDPVKPGDPDGFALVLVRQWAANCRVYPAWGSPTACWPAEWCDRVRRLAKARET
jgi:hypothetical protein